MPHNLAILAGAGLRLIGIHDKIMRPTVLILRHKRPFQPRRKPRATTPTQTRRLHLIDDPIPPLVDKELRSVPIATLLGSLQVSAMKPVKIGENAVFVLQHDRLSFRRFGSSSLGCLSRFNSFRCSNCLLGLVRLEPRLP